MSTRLEELKACKTLNGFAKMIGYKPADLSYIAYKIADDNKYTVFEIPKKTKGVRVIASPVKSLKKLQRALADLLTDSYLEIYGKRKVAYGFIPKLGIYDNAKLHTSKRFVLNIDLKDFFPSINFGRIRGFFMQNRYFQLSESVSTVIAQIVCYKGVLPQGSPCSPIVSNLIATHLDSCLMRVANDFKCTYSRYVDDITFSTSLKTFPKELAILKENNIELGNILLGEIIRAGFEVNKSKVRLQYRRSSQSVTGLTVNKKVNVNQRSYRLLRSITHKLFSGKPVFHLNSEVQLTIKQIEGIVSHIYWIKNGWKIRNAKMDKSTNAFKGIALLFQRLLIFKLFFADTKPLLITEGETDSIYIKCALRHFFAKGKYLKLVSMSNGKYKFNISFLNFAQKNQVGDKLLCATGTGGMANLIDRYKQHEKKFILRSIKPVFFFTDNDKAGKDVMNKFISKFTGTNLNIDEAGKSMSYNSRIHAYTVIDKTDGVIEELFEKNFLDRKNKFNKILEYRKEDYSPDTYFGKMEFAKEIVSKEWESINFDGFIPLLDYLELHMN